MEVPLLKSMFKARERGQVFLLTALLLPVLLGMAGLAIDLGSYSSERRSLQNAADSIALAAGQDLPDATKATTTAQAWASRNNVAWSNVTFAVSGGTTAPRVTVSVSKPHPFSFIKIVGITSSNVGARAVAGKYSPGANSGVVPWSVTQATVDGSVPGAIVTIKYDANNVLNGNFGPIRVDGSGATDYQNAATYGASSQLCSINYSVCAPGVGETAPECDGPACKPKTGNMTGPTRNAVDFRMQYTNSACDTFSEVFSSVGGRYVINPACNPWSGGACPPAPSTALCSRRVFLIPVIDGFGNGSSTPVTIQRFALVFLEGYTGSCTGNSCDVRARFVDADITTNAFAGGYDPNASVHFVKLVE